MPPLLGLKVLDLSRILAGPWATQCLADFGADVLKIEKPGEGDDTRQWGPPYVRAPDGADTAESAYYLSCNRGKRSVAMDIATIEGQQLVRELAQHADILVENFKVGALAKYGLDFASLHALNPKLIYCSITGYGQTGPNKDLPGYDAMIQARAGLMSLTGLADGEPGAGPQKVGVAVADLMCGMYAVSAILAAVHARNRDGIGQHIDLALFDTQVAWLANQASNYLIGDVVPQRLGTAHPNIVPYQAFATADGYVMLAVGNDRQFQKFCTAASAPALEVDPQFANNALRVAAREKLLPLIAKLMRQYSTADWLEKLAEAGVPCGPINDLQEVFAESQIAARGLVQTQVHSSGTVIKTVANPVKFSATEMAASLPPPHLGEHTNAALMDWLAIDATRLAKLRSSGVLG
jgi:crotonobetainyl-CoA:carnitine CoA-transferase CaiB-like acyl-CoA transferase